MFSPSANGGVRDISWKNNDKAAISDIYLAFQRIVNPVRGTLCEITTIWPLTNHINAKKRHSLRRVRLVKTPSAAIWMIVANTKQGRQGYDDAKYLRGAFPPRHIREGRYRLAII